MKKQPTEWEKIFEKNISDKEGIDIQNKEHIHTYQFKKKKPAKKWAEDQNIFP